MGRKPKRSMEAQRRIVQQMLRGEESCAALARRYRLSDQTLYRWQKKFLASNELFSQAETSTEQRPVIDGPRVRQYETELDSFVRDCPLCGSHMTADYRNRRTVITVMGHRTTASGWPVTWRLTSRIRRCHNSGCDRFLIPYRPEAEGRIAFPNQKLGIVLLLQIKLLLSKGKESSQLQLTSRQIQARLSAGGINLSHSTIENTLERLANIPKDPKVGIQNFLNTHPKQKQVLLDIFPWTKSKGHNVQQWMVRDCLSGAFLLTFYGRPAQLLYKLLAALPIPVVGVLCPKSGTTIPLAVRQFLPQLHPVAVPTLPSLSGVHEQLCGPLGVPVCYWQLPVATP